MKVEEREASNSKFLALETTGRQWPPFLEPGAEVGIFRFMTCPELSSLVLNCCMQQRAISTIKDR